MTYFGAELLQNRANLWDFLGGVLASADEEDSDSAMARIVYGVMGDSRGHMSRSLAVAQSMPQHEYLFVGGGAVHELQKEGYHVEDVPMASTLRRDNKVDVPATVLNAVKVFSRGAPVVTRLAGVIKSFNPDLIITDYEFFTPLAARRLGRSCVSLDHQHVLTHCRYDPPPGQGLNRVMTCSAIRYLYSAANRFLVVSFFALPPADPSKTEVFPAIVRRVVEQLRPIPGDYGLVYLPDRSFHGLVPVLEGRRTKFLIYGMGAHPARANLVFKETSIQGFADDIAGCRYVLSNAGHSLISEALYLGKPVLSFPRDLEYEQYLNAYFLARFGFGSFCASMSQATETLDAFEANLGQYELRVRRERFTGNERLVAHVEELVRTGYSR
jgi:uncharacterized protein (TIGR00661 family)